MLTAIPVFCRIRDGVCECASLEQITGLLVQSWLRKPLSLSHFSLSRPPTQVVNWPDTPETAVPPRALSTVRAVLANLTSPSLVAHPASTEVWVTFVDFGVQIHALGTIAHPADVATVRTPTTCPNLEGSRYRRLAFSRALHLVR